MALRRLRPLLPVLLLLGGGLVLRCGEPPQPPPAEIDLTAPLGPGEVRAGVVTDRAALIGGPKADGVLGDIKMYNAEAAFIIEGVRRASGYRYWGGNVADADVIHDGPGNDRFGETIFSWNLRIFRPETVEILNDGTNGEAAHVRFTGRIEPFAFADDLIRALIDTPDIDLKVTYDYVLEPDSNVLELAITLENDGTEPAEVAHPFILNSQGDGAHPYVPGVGFRDLQASGVLPYLGSVGAGPSYAFISRDDAFTTLYGYKAVTAYSQTPFTLEAGQSTRFEYDFVVTDRGAAGLDEAYWRALGVEVAGRLQVELGLPPTAAPESAWIAVRDGTGGVASIVPYRQGGIEIALDPGDYTVEAYAPGHAPAPPVAVTVPDGGVGLAQPALEAAAEIHLQVKDPDGSPVPARVTFLPQEGTPLPYAPEDVRFGWDVAPASAYAYVTDPEGDSVRLPAGTYRAVATRGFSYTIDETTVSVAPGETATLTFTLEKVVDTTGWVSSDFHIHAIRSPDSYVPYAIRARQAATEDLDAPILTEHVVAAGLKPTAEALGLGQTVVGVPGQEVTTFAYGHFNAFPLVWDPEKPNWGAVFEHGQTPQELFHAIRTQHDGDVVLQINHPRGAPASGYFTYVGLDAERDAVEKEREWTLDFDTIEVLNGNCRKTGGNGETLRDWIGLTNHGHKKTLASGSDTHTESRVVGTPRNWIRLDKSALRGNHFDLVPPVQSRQLFVSCGPFVEFTAKDGTGLGGRTQVDEDGTVTFHVRVQAPEWMTVTTLHLWENGEPIQTVDLSGAEGVVRFDGTLSASPEADAWYVVEVVGEGDMYPVTTSGPPYAITNPIEVDADGDGAWTPPALQ